jgi:hypothetical protein
MSESIGLAAFLSEVKRELMETQPEDTDRLLMVEDVELEIRVGISYEGRAGVKVYVLELGGGAKRDDTHTVRVRLQPLLSHEQRLEELKRDPRWSHYVKASIRHTVKSAGNGSQSED